MARPVVIYPDFLHGPDLDRLRERALASGYVGRSPLSGTFAASRGFGLTFTRAGLPTLRARLPFLYDFFCRVTAAACQWEVQTRLEGWLGRMGFSRSNAFYLNLLVLPGGAAVGPHIDATLWPRVGGHRPVRPRVVSVLYLGVPRGAAGGSLELSHEGIAVATVTPRPGQLVHFRGHLSHEVVAHTGIGADGLRVSLVCEQYVLRRGQLVNVPPFHLASSRAFEQVLERVQRRGSAPVVLD